MLNRYNTSPGLIINLNDIIIMSYSIIRCCEENNNWRVPRCRHHTVLQMQSCWRKLLRCFAASSHGPSRTAVCVNTSSAHYSWRWRPQVNIDLHLALLCHCMWVLCDTVRVYFCTRSPEPFTCLASLVEALPLLTSHRTAFMLWH